MKIYYDNIWQTDAKNPTTNVIENWIIPSREMLPAWFDELKVDKQSPNVRTCASYVETFKNSMVYRLPQDLRLVWEDVEEVGQPMVFQGEDHDMYDLVKCESHTSFLGNDLLGNFSDQFHNVKIDSNLILKSEKGRVDCIMMDTFHWNPISKYRTAQGVLPILDNKEVMLNINLWVPKIFKEITLPKNTPLALLYFPMGIPEFEYKKIEITEREQDMGEYLGKMARCPFNHS